MRVLLDTHVFLWYITGDARLPRTIDEAIREPRNAIFLSVVSVWEAIIKNQLGKLPLPGTPQTWLPLQRDRHRITSLTLDEASVARLATLPSIHRDPFDRIMVCQALEHGMALATVDSTLVTYPVPLVT